MNLRRLFWGKRTNEVKLEAANEDEKKVMKKDSIVILDEDVERCEKVSQSVQKALTIMNAELTVTMITEPFEIMELGIIEQPVIMVEGKVLVKGRMLSTTDLIQLLHNYV